MERKRTIPPKPNTVINELRKSVLSTSRLPKNKVDEMSTRVLLRYTHPEDRLYFVNKLLKEGIISKDCASEFGTVVGNTIKY